MEFHRNTLRRRLAIVLPIEFIMYMIYYQEEFNYKDANILYLGAQFVPVYKYIDAEVKVILPHERGMLFALVPPLLLVLAGFATAIQTRLSSITRGLKEGKRIIYIHFVICTLLAILSWWFWFAPPSYPWRPDLTLSLIVAGVVYPMTFGAAGGVLAWGSQTILIKYVLIN